MGNHYRIKYKLICDSESAEFKCLGPLEQVHWQQALLQAVPIPPHRDSTWGHPQPEVILPSLIPLVFERFFCLFQLCGCPESAGFR